MHTVSEPTPRIYVACLASYNGGRLHGRWIDADQDAEDIRQEIAAMLKESPEPGAEEFAIHDYEGFGGYPLGEYEAIEAVAELAELLDEHGEVFGEVAAHLGTIEDAKRVYENCGDCGEWDSLEDYAADLLEQTGGLEGLPEHLRFYFDFEAFGRDMERNGDIFTIEDGRRVHVFDANA